jgi:hypothetical protein
MKRINTLVMLLILSIMQVCAQSLVGTWYSIGNDDTQQVYEFKSNGTFSFKLTANAKMDQYGTCTISLTYTGKYVRDGKSLALTFDKSSYSSTINFTLSDQVKSQLASYPSNKAKIDAALNQLKKEQKQKLDISFEKQAALGTPCQITLLNDRYLECSFSSAYEMFSKKGHTDETPWNLKSVYNEQYEFPHWIYDFYISLLD